MEYLHEALDRAWRVSLSLAPWVVVVLGLVRVLRARPAVVHVVTIALAAAHLIPFVLPTHRHVVALGPGMHTEGTGGSALPFDTLPLPWSVVLLLGLWLTSRDFVAAFRSRRRMGPWRPVPTGVAVLIARLGREVGVRRVPEVSWCDDDQGPLVQEGWRGPRLWIPEVRWSTWTPGAREAILLHELAHLRRRDGIVHGIWTLLRPLYWWNPVLLWLRRRSQENAELACDRWATSRGKGHREHYARALLELARQQSESRWTPGEAMLGRGRRRLEQRIRSVFRDERAPTSRMLPWVALIPVALGSCLVTGQLGVFEKRHHIDRPDGLRSFLETQADPAARRAAVDAVGNMQSGAAEGIPGILVAAFGQDPSASVRYEILDALDRLAVFGDFEPFLTRAQEDPVLRVRRRARELLDRSLE